MRRVTMIGVAVAALVAVAGVDGAAAKAKRDGWPDTAAGRRARGWVDAFSTGEKEMRAFLERQMAESTLARRPVLKRVESYRKLRERYGSLALLSVERSTPTEVQARLMAADGSAHSFVFTVQDAAPHKLVSVGIRERVHGHPGFGH